MVLNAFQRRRGEEANVRMRRTDDASETVRRWRETSGFQHPAIQNVLGNVALENGEKPDFGFVNSTMFLACALAKGPSRVTEQVLLTYSDAATTSTLFLGVVFSYLLEPPPDMTSSMQAGFYSFGLVSVIGFSIIIIWNLLLSFTMVNHLRESDLLVFLVHTLPSLQRFLVWLFFLSVASSIYFVVFGMLATAPFWTTTVYFILITLAVAGFTLHAQRQIVFGPNGRVLNDYFFQQRASSLQQQGAFDPCDMSYLVNFARHKGKLGDILAKTDSRSENGYVPCGHAQEPNNTNGGTPEMVETLTKLAHLLSTKAISDHEFDVLKTRLMQDFEVFDQDELPESHLGTLGRDPGAKSVRNKAHVLVRDGAIFITVSRLTLKRLFQALPLCVYPRGIRFHLKISVRIFF